MIFPLKNYLRCVIFYMSIFATRLPIYVFFSLFSTHFKWSKPGLKQNCKTSLSPINQDFLESCQYIAVAYKQYFYHFLLSPHKSYFLLKRPVFKGFPLRKTFDISDIFSFLLIFPHVILCNLCKNLCKTIRVHKAILRILPLFSVPFLHHQD